jgi:hypothetical protein
MAGLMSANSVANLSALNLRTGWNITTETKYCRLGAVHLCRRDRPIEAKHTRSSAHRDHITAETGSRSASRMIATICSSVKRALRIGPSESGASLSTSRWVENPETGQNALHFLQDTTLNS